MTQKAFYEVGLHHCKITAQRFYMHKKKDSDEKMAVFEANFDVIQRVDPTNNEVKEHTKKFNRQFQVYIKSSNFDVCYEQISNLLKLCQVKEVLTDFSKLDPDNPGHINLVGKTVPMWCAHNKEGWERWMPSTEKKEGGKSKTKNDPEAVEWLNSMFGSRLQNKAAQAQEESVSTGSESLGEPGYVVSDDSEEEEMPF